MFGASDSPYYSRPFVCPVPIELDEKGNVREVKIEVRREQTYREYLRDRLEERKLIKHLTEPPVWLSLLWLAAMVLTASILLIGGR